MRRCTRPGAIKRASSASMLLIVSFPGGSLAGEVATILVPFVPDRALLQMIAHRVRRSQALVRALYLETLSAARPREGGDPGPRIASRGPGSRFARPGHEVVDSSWSSPLRKRGRE